MSNPVSRWLSAGVLSVLVVFALVSLASAHALYKNSTPAANAVLNAEPSTLTVAFVEGVNPRGSSLTVTGPNGVRADNGDGHVDRNNPARDTMVLSLKPGLGPGTYTVNWTTVSADDGDAASGKFSFTVWTPDSAPGPAASSGSMATSAQAAGLPNSGGVPFAIPAALGIGLIVAGRALRRPGR